MATEVTHTTSLVGQESVWTECVNQFDTPSHIFITGTPGCGKTTLMREILQEYAQQKHRPNSHIWGYETTDECLLLGPEQDRGIQTIRGQVSMFIRQISLGEDIFRWVVIDDVDTFPQISQQALRRPMETYSHITRFLFIGTSEEDLIPALRSRCIHISMNTVDPFINMKAFLNYVNMPITTNFTDDMWSWIINIAGNNTSDLVRLLKLIRDISVTFEGELTIQTVRALCSAPYYLDFLPLLKSMAERNVQNAIKSLLVIWKRGYAYEDILESFQTINNLFGTGNIHDNTLIHKFLINSWISYCKGNTSILALQNVVYKTLSDTVVESDTLI
jgi:replication factor C subunit 2/4